MKAALIEKELKSIHERNRKVEADKAWETSWTRRIAIALFTYLVIAGMFYAMGVPEPFLNALIPPIAFMISTLTLPLLKKVWIENFYRHL